MADERQSSAGNEQSDEGRDGGRRRYFRRRQRPSRSGREGGGRESGGRSGNNNGREQEHAQARRRGSDRRAPENAEQRDPRLSRRRRRSRTRTNGSPTPRAEVTLQEVVVLDDYVAPSSVFVYTHISRAGSGLDTYEFRAEHFSHGGRTLEEFQIDLSKLYPDSPKDSRDQTESKSEA